MRIKYPLNIDTPQLKTAFLYRLYELVRIDGNKHGWTDKRQLAHEIIMIEVNINRKQLKEDITNPADLRDIEGY